MHGRLLQLLLRGARHGLLLHDAQFRFLSVNPAAVAMLGYTEAELLRMGLSDIEPDFNRYGIRQRLEGLAPGERLISRGRPRTCTGDLLDVEVTVTALEYDEQRLYAVDLRPLQGDPPHRLAHELASTTQILQGIQQELSETLLQGLPADALLLDNLSGVLGQLSDQVQTLQGKQSIIETVDLRHLARRALAQARRTHSFQGVKVAIVPCLAPLPVQVAPPRIERLLIALLLNAAEATAGASLREVEVSFASSGDWARCMVRDTGPGLPAHLGERIFAPGVTTKPGVAGLGLTAAREAARSYGGDLTATNGPFSGAQLVLSLPQLPAQDSVPS